MKKTSKLTILLYAYFAICIIHSSYSFYSYVKNYFNNDKIENTKEQDDKLVQNAKEKEDVKLEENLPKNNISKNHYVFAKNSNVNTITEDMILDDSEFLKYRKRYNYYLNKYFTTNHLKGLKEIVIADAEMFSDGSCGITESIDGKSFIIIASKYEDNTVIVHEALHAVHAYHIELFDTKYKNKWLKCNDYVSDYAKTNVYEDFAETGTKYLFGDTLIKNKKFQFFSDFYNEIK